MLIYKILLPYEWADFQATGEFSGTPFDIESGFIHCSSRQQVGATAVRVFADKGELVVLASDAAALDGPGRGEPASEGDEFPQVYGLLALAAVCRCTTFLTP